MSLEDCLEEVGTIDLSAAFCLLSSAFCLLMRCYCAWSCFRFSSERDAKVRETNDTSNNDTLLPRSKRTSVTISRFTSLDASDNDTLDMVKIDPCPCRYACRPLNNVQTWAIIEVISSHNISTGVRMAKLFLMRQLVDKGITVVIRMLPFLETSYHVGRQNC